MLSKLTKTSLNNSRRVIQPRLLTINRIRPIISRTNATSTQPRTLKSSPMSMPKETPKSTKTWPTNTLAPKKQDDFSSTKLVHGQTKLKIAISQRASDKLEDIAKEDNEPQTALRITVESGGCHGFQYNLHLTSIPKEIGENDQILVFTREGAKVGVIFDEASLEILQESKVDFTKELIGSSFKVVESPYTSTECGCGASFDFDFEKLQKKQEQEAESSS